ncbi:MAG: hypothetical protein WB422_05685, partial [Pseudolabrys sp.]
DQVCALCYPKTPRIPDSRAAESFRNFTVDNSPEQRLSSIDPKRNPVKCSAMPNVCDAPAPTRA